MTAVMEVRDVTTECWRWQGRLDREGYGRIKIPGGNDALAHRVSYERLVGPVPDGLELDHLCRVRSCVNPDHLEPVTHAENMARSARARLTHCPQGHPYDEANTYRWRATGRQCRQCRREQQAARRATRGDHPRARHGLAYTYNAFGCRCAPCRSAKAEQTSAYYYRSLTPESGS